MTALPAGVTETLIRILLTSARAGRGCRGERATGEREDTGQAGLWEEEEA